MKYINSYAEYLKENAILYLDNSIITKRKIEGKFLNKEEVAILQKEIEDNYIEGDIHKHFTREKDDIRTRMFSYDYPIMQKIINGNDVRIAEGLIRNNKSTYLVYINGNIVGEFYSVLHIKDIFNYIESQLMKNIE